MPHNLESVHSLRRVFEEAFTVRDLAEPLVSFDAETPSSRVRDCLEARGFAVAGVRVNGAMVGYLERDQLDSEGCGLPCKPFDESLVIADSAPLTELVLRLNTQPRQFVMLLGAVGGIVSRSDLQKPPVRMWLFGMLTLIEMRLARLIESACPDEAWHEFLSAGRLEKSQALLAERKRRNQALTLLDCLQLSDKIQIVARSETIRSMTRFASRRALEDAGKRLEKLRNNLAHAQDIITNDWETIVALSEQLDSVLEGPPGLRKPVLDE